MGEANLHPSDTVIENLDKINKAVCQLKSACDLFSGDAAGLVDRKSVTGVMWLFDDKLGEIRDASEGIHELFKPSRGGIKP